MKLELTSWFKGNLKPVRAGVYQRDYQLLGNRDNIGYCKWNGKTWMQAKLTIEDASKENRASFYQNLPWRGILK